MALSPSFGRCRVPVATCRQGRTPARVSICGEIVWNTGIQTLWWWSLHLSKIVKAFVFNSKKQREIMGNPFFFVVEQGGCSEILWFFLITNSWMREMWFWPQNADMMGTQPTKKIRYGLSWFILKCWIYSHFFGQFQLEEMMSLNHLGAWDDLEQHNNLEFLSTKKLVIHVQMCEILIHWNCICITVFSPGEFLMFATWITLSILSQLVILLYAYIILLYIYIYKLHTYIYNYIYMCIIYINYTHIHIYIYICIYIYIYICRLERSLSFCGRESQIASEIPRPQCLTRPRCVWRIRAARCRFFGSITGYGYFNGSQIGTLWYPLVNSHITMERSTIFNGQIHYKSPCSKEIKTKMDDFKRDVEIFHGISWNCLVIDPLVMTNSLRHWKWHI